MKTNPVLKSFVLPGLPQPLLTPKANPGYGRLREAFEKVRVEIEATEADVILIYSTMWPSVLGHQIQCREMCEWVHVDEEFHDLGSIPYKLRMDKALGQAYVKAGEKRGLHMRSVDYHGFPIDTGSVVALKLINPDNRLPAVIISSNMYADRAETVVLGKAALDALQEQNKKAVAVVISTLSNRLHQTFVSPAEDKIHSLKDQEWNLKMIEFFEKGRLEDLSQLSRQIQKEARVKKVNNFKPLWWLSTVSGPHNRYKGEVLAYEPVCGTGSAVVSLTPTEFSARDLEFDEDSPEFYSGERNVLGPSLNESKRMTSQTLNAGFEDAEDEHG
jgi:2-aminophenol/2-amino-5-chlorophenol 1,6-dioxygenase alpha subunit